MDGVERAVLTAWAGACGPAGGGRRVGTRDGPAPPLMDRGYFLPSPDGCEAGCCGFIWFAWFTCAAWCAGLLGL